MYRHINIQKFHILPTDYICVFGTDPRTKDDGFATHH